MSDEEMYNFSVAEIPPHKHYQRDPKRLTKVVIDGKAPEEHPWCHFASTSVIMGINKSGIPDYQKGWEFIKWR